MKVRRGMVFGVFDGLHEGHRHFLSSAASKCDELVVAVALSEVAKALKGKVPARSLEERMSAIKNLHPAFLVVPGDAKLGSWDVVTKEKPDIVFLGYDQAGIEDALSVIDIPVFILGVFESATYTSSISGS